MTNSSFITGTEVFVDGGFAQVKVSKSAPKRQRKPMPIESD